MNRLRLVAVAVCCVLPIFLSTPSFGTELRFSPQGRLAPQQSHYNLRYGTFRVGFAGQLSLTYGDNVTYADAGESEVDSWSLVPSLTMDVYWPISPYAQIDSHFTVGYKYYFDDDATDDWFVGDNEGSLAADFSAQYRFWDDNIIEFRNIFSREIDSLDIAARGRGDDYALTRNIVELQYSKDLRPDTSMDLQYAHTNAWTNDEEFEYLDYASDAFDAAVLYQLTPRVRVGPYARWESTRFTEDIRNDRVTYEAGLTSIGSFSFGSIVNYNVSLGYESIALDSTNDPTADDDEGGFTAAFQTSITPTLFPGHRVRASYERNHTSPNPGVNYADELLLGYGLDFRLTNDLMVSADVDWLDINESDDGEEANLWRFYMRTSYSLTPKTDLSAAYRFTTKSSDMDDREYDQNTFQLTIRHQF